jgi:hypothetical protein
MQSNKENGDVKIVDRIQNTENRDGRGEIPARFFYCACIIYESSLIFSHSGVLSYIFS